MPRRVSATALGTRAKDVLQAYSVIKGKIRPEGSLTDLQQHWQAIEALVVALKQQCNDNVACQELVLRTTFPKQVLASVAAALQQVAAAGSSVGPEEPALATAANLTGSIALIFGSMIPKECQPKLVDFIKNSGEEADVHACLCTDASL
jgi:hypothetical protein